MAEMLIKKDVIIDDAAIVLAGISYLSNQQVSSLETVKRFINEEKHTIFYLDAHMNCSMERKKGHEYLWLDTGFLYRGEPIFISTIKKGGQYLGHYYGTANELSKQMRGSVTKAAVTSFIAKYNKKIEQRTNLHIANEQSYLLGKCNDTDNSCTLGSLISALNIDFAPEPVEEEMAEVLQEEVVDNITSIEERQFTKFEEEITIDLLLDTIDGMQAYMDELAAKIEELTIEDMSKQQDLEEMWQRNAEYKRALVQMRDFINDEEEEQHRRLEAANTAGTDGHLLLGGKKILILGETNVDKQIVKGIAKVSGFVNDDLEFETDYSKVVNFAGRIKNNGRFYAVIVGANPHKVKGLGDASSIIEKCRQEEGMPIAFDAHTMSGNLKATKQAIKTAIQQIRQSLHMEAAS